MEQHFHLKLVVNQERQPLCRYRKYIRSDCNNSYKHYIVRCTHEFSWCWAPLAGYTFVSGLPFFSSAPLPGYIGQTAIMLIQLVWFHHCPETKFMDGMCFSWLSGKHALFFAAISFLTFMYACFSCPDSFESCELCIITQFWLEWFLICEYMVELFMQVILDGYSAPLTAGNFAKLVR